MKLTCRNQAITIETPCTVLEALTRMGLASTDILAVWHHARLMELGDLLENDGELIPITLQNEEGRRIYERSLRFVMLLALKKLFPRARVRVEYSVSSGILVRLPDHALTDRDMRAIRDEMRSICKADLPFTHETWKTEDARQYFLKDGQADKVTLLGYRRLPTIRMYQCGGMYEYFYGAMVPSTGYVSVFEVGLHQDGFVLSLPQPEAPSVPAPYVDFPRHLSVFAQSAHWCSILGVENVSDLTRLIETRALRDFIRVNEALHEQTLVDIARAIADNGKRVVLIAGPSSSGKTTFAGRLAIQLHVLGFHAHRISLDNYYRNRDEIPLEEDGTVDLEHIRAIDVPLIREQTAQLLEGQAITLPVYSFQAKAREKEGIPLQLGPQDIVIFEGIHALNPLLCEGLDDRRIHRIFVSALTCLNLDDHNRIRTTDVRLLRRIVRDYQFRGTSPENTLAMWESVRKGEKTWIFPYQETADTFFNTALHYELPVLGYYARPLLQHVHAETPGYLRALRLKKMLKYLPAMAST